ncbi:MAG: hypothetical protein DI604_28110 [Delftia acidovorans]|nr:MAG: hypothetical protein DI604_28110 [Delftia acidovorans]
MRAYVEKGGDGRFYIAPVSACANGIAFAQKANAERIADAINMAFLAGKEEIRSSLRDLIGAAERQEGV